MERRPPPQLSKFSAVACLGARDASQSAPGPATMCHWYPSPLSYVLTPSDAIARARSSAPRCTPCEHHRLGSRIAGPPRDDSTLDCALTLAFRPRVLFLFERECLTFAYCCSPTLLLLLFLLFRAEQCYALNIKLL